MHIEELSCKPNNKSITVVLTYDEVRDMANGFYHLISGTECDKDKYKGIAAKLSLLFDMIKYGNIQPETIKKFETLRKMNKTEEANE